MGEDRKYVFKLIFFKDLNAFEIYKCVDELNHEADKTFSFHDGKTEWDFKWQDKLIIDWDNETPGAKHFLRFKNESPTPQSSRSSPIDGYENYSAFEITKGEKIMFVERGNATAEWSFEFCWGKSIDDNDAKVIDPKAKVKETGT